MLSRLINIFQACWRPSLDCCVHTGSDSSGGGARQGGLLWYKGTRQHLIGDFSMAVAQADNLLEVQSQIESGHWSFLDSGPCGMFIGVYDGQDGPEMSRYINDNLFQNRTRFETKQQGVFSCYKEGQPGSSLSSRSSGP